MWDSTACACRTSCRSIGRNTTCASSRSDQEVRDIGEQRVVAALVELLGGPPRLAHRHPHQPRAGRDALVAHHRLGERLRGQQQRRVGGDRDLPLQADLLQHQPRLLVPHHHVVHLRQHRAHRVPVLGVGQRPGADGVGEGGRVPGLRGAHQAQIAPRLAVVQDSAAAQHEEVQAGQHVEDVVAADPLPGHHLVGVGVMGTGVLRVPAQDDEVEFPAAGPHRQLQHAGQDRLVADVEATVRNPARRCAGPGGRGADARAEGSSGDSRHVGIGRRAPVSVRGAAHGAGLPAPHPGNTLAKNHPYATRSARGAPVNVSLSVWLLGVAGL
ncbi:hypothetical protein STENM36S_07937 [Streptomyces tendae]